MHCQAPSAPDEIIKKCHEHETHKTVADMSNNYVTPISNNHPTSGNNNSRNISGPVHYLHELPHAAEERYAQVFNKLDRKGMHFAL